MGVHSVSTHGIPCVNIPTIVKDKGGFVGEPVSAANMKAFETARRRSPPSCDSLSSKPENSRWVVRSWVLA
jgi:hypothetical protein